MLLIDEMLKELQRRRGLGLCRITSGGALYVGRVATLDDAARMARRLGRGWPSYSEIDFVVHQHNGLSGWSAGTTVVARFDRHGKRTDG